MRTKLGQVQLRVMRVLWDRGEATAREITDAMSQTAPTMLSTVQTLLRQLEGKGLVGHEQRERTFYFRALVAEADVRRSAAKDLLDRVYRGSLTGLVAHLLDEDPISEGELYRLKQLIAEKEKEMGS